jgi:hypothetical protein
MYCLCNQQEQEYTSFIKKMFMNAMEDNYDWLANNKTWKKWTGLGDGGLLSYAGINFHKPKDEEQLVGPRGAPTTCHNQHGASRSYSLVRFELIASRSLC